MKSFVIVVLVALLSCSGYYEEHVTQLSNEEFVELMQDATAMQLVDVRTEREFAKGAIPEAVNIDVDDEHFDEKVKQFSTDKPIYVYCRTGIRSKSAAKRIAELGFTQVYELHEGYKGWIDNNATEK